MEVSSSLIGYLCKLNGMLSADAILTPIGFETFRLQTHTSQKKEEPSQLKANSIIFRTRDCI